MLFSMTDELANLLIYCKFSNNKIFLKIKKILRRILYLKRYNKSIETIMYN